MLRRTTRVPVGRRRLARWSRCPCRPARARSRGRGARRRSVPGASALVALHRDRDRLRGQRQPQRSTRLTCGYSVDSILVRGSLRRRCGRRQGVFGVTSGGHRAAFPRISSKVGPTVSRRHRRSTTRIPTTAAETGVHNGPGWFILRGGRYRWLQTARERRRPAWRDGGQEGMPPAHSPGPLAHTVPGRHGLCCRHW